MSRSAHNSPDQSTNELEVCVCAEIYMPPPGLEECALCRIRNVRVNPSYDGFMELTNTGPFVCWGFSWEPWLGAAPKLLVWDYPLILVTVWLKMLCDALALDSLTQGLRQVRSFFEEKKRSVLPPPPYFGRGTKVLAYLKLSTLSLVHLIKSCGTEPPLHPCVV